MTLVSFRLFRKNLGNLREVFGQKVYRPPGKKLPVRLWILSDVLAVEITTNFNRKKSVLVCIRQGTFVKGGSNTILTALRGRSQEQRCWKWASIGWFTVFSKDPEGGAWLSKFSSGVVIESDADHADDRWCTNDAKLAWVDLPSNVAKYYPLLFNIGCVAGAWK